jgi:hypothetical protein
MEAVVANFKALEAAVVVGSTVNGAESVGVWTDECQVPNQMLLALEVTDYWN